MNNIAQHLAAFFPAADAIIDNGLDFARQDDPHRFATLGREFDDGRALRRLVVDYMPDDRMRIALVFIGTEGGEEKMVEVFSTTVQAARAGGVH